MKTQIKMNKKMKQVIIGIIIFSMISTGFATTIAKSDGGTQLIRKSVQTPQVVDSSSSTPDVKTYDATTATSGTISTDTSTNLASLTSEQLQLLENMKYALNLPAKRKAAAENFWSLYYSTNNPATKIKAQGGSNPAPLIIPSNTIPHFFGPYPNYANSPLPTGAVTTINLASGGSGYSATPTVTITDMYTNLGTGATATATVTNGVITSITLVTGGTGYSSPQVVITDATGTGASATAAIGGTLNGGIRKFVDSLPGLGSANANNLGQYLPIAVADTTTFPGCDYYEIALVRYTEQMHSELPATLLNGYVQLETPVNFGVSNHIALTNPDGTPILKADGTQAIAVDNPHYLGPIIVSQRDVPVRLTFYNLLPNGMGGDLFIPVDTTVMGSGMGPIMIMPMDVMYMPGMTMVTINTMDPHNLNVGQLIQLENFLPDVYNGQYRVDSVGSSTSFDITLSSDPGSAPTTLGHIMECYPQDRATLHLHGGNTPWISDGIPHQWTTPANETTQYPKGVSVEYVPDMWFVNGAVASNTVGQTTPPAPGATNNPGDGGLTFYYTNQQSARLMFYHDHSYGITRLNVYSGEAAGYVLTDQVEQDMIAGTDLSGVNPNNLQVLPDIGIPLVIEDKTFVDANTIAYQDPLWQWGSTPGIAHTGDLWFPHVYMPNQNKYSMDGGNAFGRWDYGPWFFPPTTDITYPPVPNPYYDPINAPWEPKLNPGVPSTSMVMEAFSDTPVVNGVAYPYLDVQPTTYRFRILNAGNDRTLNLQLYQSDPTIASWDGRNNTEVKMVPAVPTPGYPITWPTDGRPGGAPDPTTVGPSFIQIGTEGGFLPAPTVLTNQPVTFNLNPKTFNYGNVLDKTLALGPAERADVLIDFSQFAGKTIILYNDGPAAWPAADPRNDYFTGCPDNSFMGGAPTTMVGYGPNTRTILQFRVNNTTSDPQYDLTALESVFEKTATKPSVFQTALDPIIAPQAGHNTAYNGNFPVDNFVRIGDTAYTFQTIAGTILTIPFQEKAIHDEMSAVYDEYGRASGMLGLELPVAGPQQQVFLPYPFASPPVDIVTDCAFSPIGPVADDGTQIWRITHNGIDTHAMHFHLFNVQLINRLGWDNMILPPDSNELGWKDTIRVNPLEQTIVALRPTSQILPFDIPNSIRLLDPTMPNGAILMGPPGGFADPSAEPVTVVNHEINFGYEYMWHCHILGHEEMDMMHSIPFAVAPKDPTNLIATVTSPGVVQLTWQDNSLSETQFTIERAEDSGFTTNLVSFTVGTDVTTYTDNTIQQNLVYYYRVQANNVVGDTTAYPAPAIGFPTETASSAYTNDAMISPLAPVITTISLSAGDVGVIYSQTLTAIGGVTPYAWSISAGTLPAGLALDPLTGIISGTPTTIGTSSFTVMVTDSIAGTANKILSITINAAPVITTTALLAGDVGVVYSQTLAATGGTVPYTWSISVGALPTGLSIGASTGIISGTPTVAGTYSFTVLLTDSVSGTATQPLSILINPAPVITTTTLPAGDVGVAYSQTLAATGGTLPYTWSISVGALPTGLSLGASTGIISGTPTVAGTYSFTVLLTDSVSGTATQPLSILINGVLTITTTTLPNGQVNIVYSQTLIATGGTLPYTWSISVGALPNGLSIGASTGTISGTPTVAGTYSFTAQVFDNVGGIATQPLSIIVNPAPTITTTTLPVGDVGVVYSQTLAATGGTVPYTWSISVGALPTGLTIGPSTGTISGTPTVAGTYSFTVLLTDSVGGTATKALSILIRVAPTITTTALPAGDVGVVYSKTLVATGGLTPYTWSISAGALPTGLSLGASTGVISGTPTVAGTYSFTVLLTDSVGGTATKALSIIINVVPTITTTSLGGGDVGVVYSQTLGATGGTLPYTWSISVGALPNGLSIGASTGTISGTPTVAGTYSFTVKLTDATGGVATKALTINIRSAPTITTASLAGGDVGVAYSRTLAATGGWTPYTWSISAGSLPTGLSLNSATGVISGTPTTAGTYSFTVKLTDSVGGVATKALSITIRPAPTITTTSLPNGRILRTYSATLTATGGWTPYTWSISAGALPNGLTLNSATGVISGRPTRLGTFSFTVRLTDSVGGTATKALSIRITL